MVTCCQSNGSLQPLFAIQDDRCFGRIDNWYGIAERPAEAADEGALRDSSCGLHGVLATPPG